MRTARWRNLVAALAMFALAIVLASFAPGRGQVTTPSLAFGMGTAEIGNVEVEVHEIVLADSLLVEGFDEPIESEGVFVVVDAEVTARGRGGGILAQLEIGPWRFHDADFLEYSLELPILLAGQSTRGPFVFEVPPEALQHPAALVAGLGVEISNRTFGARAMALFPIGGTPLASLELAPFEVLT